MAGSKTRPTMATLAAGAALAAATPLWAGSWRSSEQERWRQLDGLAVSLHAMRAEETAARQAFGDNALQGEHTAAEDPAPGRTERIESAILSIVTRAGAQLEHFESTPQAAGNAALDLALSGPFASVFTALVELVAVQPPLRLEALALERRDDDFDEATIHARVTVAAAAATSDGEVRP